MKVARHVLAAASATLLLTASAASASAPTTPTTTTPPPPTTPTTPAAPSVPTPPALGKVRLTAEASGRPLFAFVGAQIVVRGLVSPYVAGQKVKVSFYRDGRKVRVKTMSVVAIGNGSGRFHLTYSSGYPGLVEARAVHYATSAQAAFGGHTDGVRYVQVNLGPGAQGPSVRLLQSELNVLHYVVPLSGVVDEGTGRALVAFRKVAGLERVPYAGRQVFEALARGSGSFHVRYPGDGRHVEGDLTRQVLAEIDPGGHVRAIYTMSSGKPSTPTVIGRFRVYRKEPGINSHGMVDSSYFISGYAIHGYAEVPTYAASHGCLRVPVPDASAIYGWVQEGMPVDVYNESGGGSSHVRSNAGP